MPSFAPERWGSLEKFSNFYSGTYKFSESGSRAVTGSINHFHKASILRKLSSKLAPNLDKDEIELKKNGFSSAINSRELSAVIESVILELYSSLDCSRKIITEIYSSYQGVPDSTRKFFRNIKEGKIDEKFPEQIKNAVLEATWYEGFRRIRDELTHLDAGACYLDEKTRKIIYIHSGIKNNGKPLIVDDIFDKIDQTFLDVNRFLGRVFSFLVTQLNDAPIKQFCGIFNARMYERYVSPHEAVDFNSGICKSRSWFELEGNPACIFAKECGAYRWAIDMENS